MLISQQLFEKWLPYIWIIGQMNLTTEFGDWSTSPVHHAVQQLTVHFNIFVHSMHHEHLVIELTL